MTTDYRKYIAQAEKLDDKELARHAAVGRICGCNDCWCCAAEHVRYVRDKNGRDYRNQIRMNLKASGKI